MKKKKLILFFILFFCAFSSFAILPALITIGRVLTPITETLVARGFFPEATTYVFRAATETLPAAMIEYVIPNANLAYVVDPE